MVWSSWSKRRARKAVLVGAAMARLSLPGSAAAQEAVAPAWDETERREDIVQRRERAALLATHLHDVIRLHSAGKAVPVLFSGIGGASLALSLTVAPAEPRFLAWTAGSATLLAGGIAALAAPEAYRRDTLGAAAQLSQGSFWLGLAFFTDSGLARATPIALSSGYYVSGLLSGLNLALSHYTPASRLRADHALVATPEWRARLSAAQIASIERDLLATAPAIPSWAIYLPVALGGVAATAPAWDGDLPAERRMLSLTSGLLASVWSLAAMFDPEHPAQSYQRDLRRAGLQVAPSGPGGNMGLTVSGKF
ncbi:hypothetical protein WME95_30210 [Sorangium sp. So ce327]|uniref:hypothetical protein n=1 Tax=Sorangium sp. So ce327 TaxID=3133301 RepID=UPI003F5E6B98